MQTAPDQLIPALNASRQMALDEALLVCAPEASIILRFYRWSGPALTFGYSQPYALALAAARRRAIPAAEVVRRATGGGIVFHDGDLTFSLCFPWTRLSPPAEIYAKIHGAAAAGLREMGVAAELWPARKQLGERPAQCFTGPEPCDVVDGRGRKMLGGALRRRSARGLYQGSLRVEGWPRNRPQLEAALARGLGRAWGSEPSQEIDSAWLMQADALADKYGSDGWNQRR